MFAALFIAALRLADPNTCHDFVPFDEIEDATGAVACAKSKTIMTVPFDVDEITIIAVDACPGEDSYIQVEGKSTTEYCKIPDGGAVTPCVLKNLPAGAKVRFGCRGSGEEGSGCAYKTPDLT
jgi:hypothetical protein